MIHCPQFDPSQYQFFSSGHFLGNTFYEEFIQEEYFPTNHFREWHPILNSNFGTCKGCPGRHPTFDNIYHHSYWRRANLISKLLQEYFARQTFQNILRETLVRLWDREKCRGVCFNQGPARFVKEGPDQKPNLGSNTWPSLGWCSPVLTKSRAV